MDDPALADAREKLERANAIALNESDPEVAKQAMDDVQKAKSLLAAARKANFKVIRRMDLDRVVELFNNAARSLAKPNEVTAFEALQAATERLIGTPGQAFDANIQDLNGKIFSILRRQDWFTVDRFNWYVEAPYLFADAKVYEHLITKGRKAIANNDVEALREVLNHLDRQRITSPDADDLIAATNIVKG
uniref:Uncharacterized protein n=1 Tax=Bosea sp. NBC_00436 TaxID=2969620 RepID=A0A9E8CLA0_9HYPH